MEALGVAASIAGVVAFGFKISTSVLALTSATKDAPAELEIICDDTSTLCGLLEQMRPLIEPYTLPGTSKQIQINPEPCLAAVKACEHVFMKLDDELKEYGLGTSLSDAASNPKTRFKISKLRRLKWVQKRKRFQDIRNDMLHAKATLSLGILITNAARDGSIALGDGVTKRPKDDEKQRFLKSGIVSLWQQKAKAEHTLQQRIATSDKENTYTDNVAPLGLITKPHENGNKPPDTPTDTRPRTLSDSQRSPSGPFITRDLSDNSPPGSSKFTHPLQPSPPVPNAPAQLESETLHGWVMTPEVNSRWRRLRLSTMDNVDSPAIDCCISPLRLPEQELQKLVRSDDDTSQQGSAPEPLLGLNSTQRLLVTRHITQKRGKLVSVRKLDTRVVPTVFGDIELSSLLWIATVPVRTKRVGFITRRAASDRVDSDSTDTDSVDSDSVDSDSTDSDSSIYDFSRPKFKFVRRSHSSRSRSRSRHGLIGRSNPWIINNDPRIERAAGTKIPNARLETAASTGFVGYLKRIIGGGTRRFEDSEESDDEEEIDTTALMQQLVGQWVKVSSADAAETSRVPEVSEVAGVARIL